MDGVLLIGVDRRQGCIDAEQLGDRGRLVRFFDELDHLRCDQGRVGDTAGVRQL